MWSLVIFLCLTITWAEAQNGRGPQHQDHNGHGWDIRLAVPGEPGNDYPTLGAIPRTSFTCAGKEPGYYADLETNCQVFRVCTVGSTYGFQSFLCPNGTLFNQAVFVCDWWMNVDCQNSQQFINNNNDKFENLRLGPQLMKDIKKMLTHPMLNPYDKTAMKSNLIVMQDYKPPLGQLFPNGALLAGPERPPNNVYVPAKQIQQNFYQNNPNDFAYSASTPDPRYLPASVNNFGSFNEDDYFQRQRQNDPRSGRLQAGQNLQNNNLISNSHAGRFIQNSNSDLSNNGYSLASRPTQISTFSQRQINSVQSNQVDNTQNNQRGQSNRQRAQYTDPRRLPQTNSERQTDFGVTFSKSQNNLNFNTNQDKPYAYNTPSTKVPQITGNVNGKAGRELKENLVSTIKDIPTTVVTKTFSRVVQENKVAKPKSRVTIKTWIVKPTKSARQLLVDPTPYTYARPSPPSPSPTEKLIEDSTTYVYEKPTTSSQTEKFVSTELDSEEPYVYTKPTPAAKQIRTTEVETTRIFIAPTTVPTRPTLSGRLSIPSSSPVPTKSSRYYLTPAPFKATDRLYLPPPRNPTTLPRLYLSPNAIPQPVYYQSAQLRASPTIPSSTRVPFNENVNQPSFTLTKHSRINANHNNLTFADILTKEKLDITVNDIVKDTDNILKTASPPQQYRKNFKSLDYRESDYVPTKTTVDSGERLTSQSPLQSTTSFMKSSRLIATPATSLVPPDESFIYQNSNQLSKLPYYKESGFPNTIERTVSIKITIPERIAMYLFKNQSEADYDKLEILNTGSSNYLVLSNNLLSKKNSFNFIPIAKLSGNNNHKNVSNSQALVYSFLTDSINVAREYNNIAQQEVLSPTSTPPQLQNMNNEDISKISNTVSQLTSSQFSSNNFNNLGKSAKLIATQSTRTNQPIPFTGNLQYSNEQTQARQNQIQTAQYNIAPSQQTQELYSSRFQVPNSQQNLLNSQNIYSGQLYQWPVPEVTNQIYNRPVSAKLISPNIQQQTTQMLTLQRNTNQNNAADSSQQSSPEIEIIKAQTLPFAPAKLQLEPPNEPEQFNSQESLANLLNSENGISAHVQDKVVGTITHPLEDNKLVTYKKDQSYFLYTKLDDNTIDQNPKNLQSNTNIQQSAKLIQNDIMPGQVTFQLIPSVNYELEDEKEQQKFLNAFRIDEFGAPREITKPAGVSESNNERQIMASNVDFTVEHPTSIRRSDQFRIDALYSGPSSYTAPQSSVGSLESRQISQNNFNSRLEDFESNNENGYPKDRPARQFVF
ncbi:uncharacterized protein LOC142980028 [Anticarsia gemmatalis]|uniref:uncharacterized protein LOC142980028 n=1 Tax=Anticarsia gemmatalis TaxID=129554 RepID=UPI003F76D515